MQVELSTVIYTIVSRVHHRSSVIYSYLHIVSRVHHRSRVIYRYLPPSRQRAPSLQAVMQSADGGRAADSNGAAATQEHTKRGQSNLPRGVGKLNKGKYQARASWTPEGASNAKQRNIGRFETIEEAAKRRCESTRIF